MKKSKEKIKNIKSKIKIKKIKSNIKNIVEEKNIEDNVKSDENNEFHEFMSGSGISSESSAPVLKRIESKERENLEIELGSEIPSRTNTKEDKNIGNYAMVTNQPVYSTNTGRNSERDAAKYESMNVKSPILTTRNTSERTSDVNFDKRWMTNIGTNKQDWENQQVKVDKTDTFRKRRLPFEEDSRKYKDNDF